MNEGATTCSRRAPRPQSSQRSASRSTSSKLVLLLGHSTGPQAVRRYPDTVVGSEKVVDATYMDVWSSNDRSDSSLEEASTPHGPPRRKSH
jgi:hypothetical protein